MKITGLMKRIFIGGLVAGLLLIPSDGNATGNILPFRSGTQAVYGMRGVHDCGFSTGWKAVDLLPQENMVYAAGGGTISYVCRDTHQVSIRVGDFLYAHLKDTGQAIGDSYNQGDALGEMVVGPIPSNDQQCGWADQGVSTFHVHFCFSGSTFQADGYTLDTGTQLWSKDGQADTDILGVLTADWSGVTPPPTGQPGMFNMWDWLVSGVIGVLTAILYPLLPPGTNQSSVVNAIGLASGMGQGILTVIELTAAALSTFNWVVPLIAFGWNMTLWAIQMAVSIYDFIMGLIKKLPLL